MTFPGPAALGRGLVTVPGRPLPAAFAEAPLVDVDDDVLAAPAAAVDRLHRCWLARHPVVVVLHVDPGAFREPVAVVDEPWRLGAAFDLPVERLHFLVWANNWDGRVEGAPRWWWTSKAVRAAGGRVRVTDGGPADALLDDRPVWFDGGPRRPFIPGEVGDCGVVHRDSIELGAPLQPAPPPVAPTRPPWVPESTWPLDEHQLAAVTHLSGPARVIAPAGSGKTTVLTTRLHHLLVDRGWERAAVAAVAFNTLAANEITTRAGEVRADVRTLNSHALAVVTGTGGFLSTGPRRRTVSDEREVRELVATAARAAGIEPPRQANTDPWLPYLEGLRAVRLALRDPAEAAVAVDAPGLDELLPRYRALLADNGVVDFDGQIDEAVRLLLADPRARLAARDRCRHLLVDEFQDLTPAHVLLLRLCAAPAFDVFAVGDDDQTIYGFGGASTRFLVDVDTYLPGAVTHPVEVNRRCPAAVVEAAAHLLSYNTERVPKTIRAADGADADAATFEVRAGDATTMAADARELLLAWHDRGNAWATAAVLARVNAALLPIQVLLTETGIPCRAAVGPAILERTGVRTALAYLRIGLDLRAISSRDIADTVRRPSRKLSPRIVEWLTERRSTSVDAVEALAGRVGGRDADKVLAYAADLRAAASRLATGDAAAFFRWVRLELGLGDVMDLLDGSRRELDRSTHTDDLLALEQVAALHPAADTFEPWLREALRRSASGRPERAPSDGDGGTDGGPVDQVTVSTIHRVKGLEWPLVVVYAADAGTLPHRRADDEEEERRIMHVAITRARARCVVLADEASPSPFLRELDGSAPRRERRRRDDGRSGDPSLASGTTPTPTARRRGGTPEPAAAVAPLVEAALSMELALRGGHSGTVVGIDRTGAFVGVGQAKERVAWGTTVTSTAGTGHLAPPGVEAALKAWRLTVARVDGKPAYTVLSDADVRGLAVAVPATMGELARCRGIGPAKLERWGDELLAVIEEALDRLDG